MTQRWIAREHDFKPPMVFQANNKRVREPFQQRTVNCREHYLHAKNLREAAALHCQLLRQLACSALLPGIALPRAPPVPELPSQKVLLLLQRPVAAGWADQVRGRATGLCRDSS